jgi:hypothetical protein
MTNAEAGAKIGKSESYASLLRRDIRVPSSEVFALIVKTFHLDPGEAVDALADHRFGKYWAEHALMTTDDESPSAPESP